MILYLDTSSLVKLYVIEKGSEQVQSLLEQAKVVATSQVAYAEACAAFARKQRQRDFSSGQYQMIITSLQQNWGGYFALDVSWPVSRLAGELAERYSLRGFDAIHLASAVTLKERLGSPVTFSSADNRLEDAAVLESLNVS